MSTVVVVNPASRHAARALAHVRRELARCGADAAPVLSTTPEHPGDAQARHALALGAERVLVAGGDGTVRAVAEVLAGTDVTLGVIPTGTANLFARTLGLAAHQLRPRDLPRAVRVAVSAPPRPVDLGVVDLVHADGRRTSRPFLVVVGVGHDADTLADLARLDGGAGAGATGRIRRRLGWLAYLLPGLRRLGQMGHAMVLDGTPVRAWSVLVLNAARLPLGASPAPGARADDGLLHLVTVAPRGLRDWFGVARDGFRVEARGPAIARRSAVSVVLAAPEADHPLPVQVDGDPTGPVTELRARIRPGDLVVAGAGPGTRRRGRGRAPAGHRLPFWS